MVAEFIRLYHSVTADVAQRLVNDLVTRSVPVIQDFDGFLKVLKPTSIVLPDVLVSPVEQLLLPV